MSHICSWRHQYVETNHVRLHCVTQGEGELVVLLHSFLEFWYSWRHQIDVLSKHFKVVVPDLRGCNDSDKPDSGYDLETVSRDIAGLIQAMGYSKAHVVGHAWGGTIAWHLAQKSPAMVEQLAVLNSVHPHQFHRSLVNSTEQLRRNWRLLALQVPAMPEWLIEQTLPEFVQAFFRNQAVRKGAFPTEVVRLYQAALGKPGAIAAALRYYRQLGSVPEWLRSLWSSAPPITVPTLVLWGEDDAFFTPDLLQTTEQLVQGSLRIERIAQCGHWIQQEVPLTVNRELIKFLRKSPVG